MNTEVGTHIEVELHADREGRIDYDERRHDVEVCGKDEPHVWPLVDQDARYIERVGIGLICNDVGIRVEQWQTWAIPWLVAFRRGYEAAHAAWLRSNGGGGRQAPSATPKTGAKVGGR